MANKFSWISSRPNISRLRVRWAGRWKWKAKCFEGRHTRHRWRCAISCNEEVRIASKMSTLMRSSKLGLAIIWSNANYININFRLSIASAHAFLLVYSITDTLSFTTVKERFEEIREQRADFQVSLHIKNLELDWIYIIRHYIKM